jgi:serine/threonine protein kinase
VSTPSNRIPDSFPRSSRFTFRRWLGEGAFGVVYEAHDERRETRVALKTLHRLDAVSIYEFKREFRALADVVHPNLVGLHELISDGDRWFFTMDLVEGIDFQCHVRNDPALPDLVTMPVGPGSSQTTSLLPSPSAATLETLTALPAGAALSGALPELVSGPLSAFATPGALDPQRWAPLRSALRQLALGLSALHAAGKLHRDVKPSNVLVTREGRVVILDFGLVMDVTPEPGIHPPLAGTPAYMAPEQVMGEPASPAGDWYAVGVMLYEALTGRLPFEGAPIQVLLRKQRETPQHPASIAPGIPEDLAALAMELLRRAPGERPTGEALLRRLDTLEGGEGTASQRWLQSAERAPFVGRERHLAQLHRAFTRAREGRATTVHVRGLSGMGKSALVRHFLDALASRDEAVILAGRCYEREAVPYKALDSLIDALSRYLARLPQARAEELLPPDVHAVVRLFPVLDRVEAIAAAPRPSARPLDAHELRRRGFAALRALLARIAAHRPLVLHIDDLQWGDADSAALLADLLREPDPPALLLLIGYRSEDADTSEMLRKLPTPAAARVGAEAEAAVDEAVCDLVVGALDPGEARALALQVLGADGDLERAEAVTREASGSPFFVVELAHGARRRAGEAPRSIRLETVLGDRLARLPREARALLETVAVAGRPLARSIAREAAALGPDEKLAAMAWLRAEHILRARGSGDDEEIETFHDRIRETVLGQLTPAELAARHLQIARALEASGRADPDALSLHFRRADRPDEAVKYALQAADRAAQALAFDRAAALYAYALEALPGEVEARRALRIKLGEALRNAGRGAEAAQEYLAASVGALADQRLDLRRLAAEQLLASGHLDEGKLVIREVLSSVGLRFFESPWAVLASLLSHRALIGLHTLRPAAPPPGALPPEVRRRMEVCWSAALGLSMTDTFWGAEFHSRYLLMALRAGDPYHLARGYAADIGPSATDAARGRRRAEGAHRRALAVATAVGDPYLIAYCSFWRGFADCLTGRFAEALARCQEAEALWVERHAGVAWELATARVIIAGCLFYRGELRTLGRLGQRYCEGAEARGDLYALTFCRITATYHAHLAAGRPEIARAEVEGAMARWSHHGFNMQHIYELLALGRIDLYSGKPLDARARVQARWPALTRSFILRFQFVRVEVHHLRASATLAAAAAARGNDARLFQTLMAEAERDVRLVSGEDAAWARPLGCALRASLASLKGERWAALGLLEEARGGFERCEMMLYAAAVKRRRGVLLGGEGGRALVRDAEAWMAGEGIKQPARMMETFAPGFVSGEPSTEGISPSP